MNDRYDLVVVGAGEAGQAAAHLARGRGASVAILHEDCRFLRVNVEIGIATTIVCVHRLAGIVEGAGIDELLNVD